MASVIQLQRLNLDSSWHLQWGDVKLLVDPWLTGPEVDGFAWLNKQWHIREPIAPQDLPDYTAILITQSYEDHCHLQTLRLLNSSVPLLCTFKAWKRLRKKLPGREYILLEDEVPATHFGLNFHAFRPDKKLDPVYYAMLISDAPGQAIFYCPHGFFLRPFQLKALENYRVQLLMTTLTDFRLPGIMGGHVNPGTENVQQLCRQLQPRYLINTHDEQKKGKGLVFTLGKVSYHPAGKSIPGVAAEMLELVDYSPQKIEM